MKEVPLILFGVGGVGSELARQILANRDFHAGDYDVRFRFLALCDSRSALIEPVEGLTDAQIEAALALKKEGNSLSDHELGGTQDDLPGVVDIIGRPRTILVDCTATEQTAPALLFGLERDYKAALANKKPLTIQQEVYDRLTRAGEAAGAPRNLSQVRWEATVGAGLPAVTTLNRLVASGDRVTQITGTFSGTLGYLMSELEEKRPFSEVVKEAYDLGYTEPDPRDDLGGVDVARKALILARVLGYRLELEDVKVSGLYPESMTQLSVDEFLAEAGQLDEQYREQVDQAESRSEVLRYVATILMEGGTARCGVGLTSVKKETPLGRLRGTDNLIEIYSKWYQTNPLVLQGPGAGVEVTAAGVLSDILELAYTV